MVAPRGFPLHRFPSDLCRVKSPLLLLVGLCLLNVASAQTDSVQRTIPLDSTVIVSPGSVVVTGEAELLPTVSEDSTTQADTLDWRQRHSPRKATIMSAIAPGAGQIYNRKYWKAPIVWAGLGVSFWFVQRNTKEYKRYKRNYLAVIDNDPTTVDEFEGRVSSSQLLDATDTYRRWRDLSYVAVGLCYLLNVVDASVDSYFVRFDVGTDLSMHLAPSLQTAAMGAPGFSLALTLR